VTIDFEWDGGKAAAFADEEAVNEALRLVKRLAQIARADRHSVAEWRLGGALPARGWKRKI
jgi:hypothetical protein